MSTPYKNTERVVKEYGIEMVSEMIAILRSRGSQHLYDEIDQKVVADMESIMLEIKMPGYGYYASEGRNPGRMPPLQSIEDWCDSRGIDQVAAYPIARKIATLGTKANASHFLKEFKITKLFEDEVLKAFKDDIAEIITENTKNVTAS